MRKLPAVLLKQGLVVGYALALVVAREGVYRAAFGDHVVQAVFLVFIGECKSRHVYQLIADFHVFGYVECHSEYIRNVSGFKHFLGVGGGVLTIVVQDLDVYFGVASVHFVNEIVKLADRRKNRDRVMHLVRRIHHRGIHSAAGNQPCYQQSASDEHSFFHIFLQTKITAVFNSVNTTLGTKLTAANCHTL